VFHSSSQEQVHERGTVKRRKSPAWSCKLREGGSVTEAAENLNESVSAFVGLFIDPLEEEVKLVEVGYAQAPVRELSGDRKVVLSFEHGGREGWAEHLWV
jgi:hypothetical protein